MKTLREKIEEILDDRNIGFDSIEKEFREEILDEIMVVVNISLSNKGG